MKKKLIVVAMLLFAICFTGFAKEAITAESSQYIAKEETKSTKPQAFTFIVIARVKPKNDKNSDYTFRKEWFRIMGTSMETAKKEAISRFQQMYSSYTIEKGSITVTCEDSGNQCRF